MTQDTGKNTIAFTIIKPVIRQGEKADRTMRFRSINEMIRFRVERSGSQAAMLYRDAGRWRERSWSDVYERAALISSGLRESGLQAGERVCIFSHTRPEWTLCDYGILGARAVVVPVSPSIHLREFEYILNSVEARFVFVEDVNLFDHLSELYHKFADRLQWIIMSGSTPNEAGVISLGDLMQRGRERKDEIFAESVEKCEPEDIATILFASYGSDAESLPKGVVLTHACILEQQYALGEVFLPPEGERTLLLLPLSHIFGRTIQMMGPYAGMVIVYLKSYDRLVDIMRETQPVFVAGVPRFFEKLDEAIGRRVQSGNLATRLLFGRTLKIGRRVSRRRRMDKDLPLFLRLEHELHRSFMLERIRQELGGRIRFFICSGSPLKRELLEFFHALNLPVLEAYGLAEFSGVAAINRPGDFRFGTVGRPLPGCRIEMDDDGEILVKAPFAFRGYWRDDEASRLSLIDGWVHTGDIGDISPDGFIRVSDRKRDMIATATGRMVSPRRLENLLTAVPFIQDAVVYGENRNFLSVLLTLDYDYVERYARSIGINYREKEELASRPEIRMRIEEAVEAVNREVSAPEKIQKFAVLEEQFSARSGELTPTRKLRRRFLYEKYRDTLEKFYK